MRTINHPLIGNIVFCDEDILVFPQGILGSTQKKYYLLIQKDEFQPLTWLVCVDDPKIIFAMINPYTVFTDYNPNITNRDLNEIKVEDQTTDLVTFVILNLNEDASQTTANLRAPILVNHNKNIGKQLILLNDTYSVKHFI